MISFNRRNDLLQKQINKEEISAKDILTFFDHVFDEDIKYLIVKTLSLREGTTLRELARNVDKSPKSLIKYLKELHDKGIISNFEASPNIKIYKLNDKIVFIRKIFISCYSNIK